MPLSTYSYVNARDIRTVKREFHRRMTRERERWFRPDLLSDKPSVKLRIYELSITNFYRFKFVWKNLIRCDKNVFIVWLWNWNPPVFRQFSLQSKYPANNELCKKLISISDQKFVVQIAYLQADFQFFLLHIHKNTRYTTISLQSFTNESAFIEEN